MCVSKLTTIGSDNGLSSGRRQAFILTNAGIVLIGPLGINFSDHVIGMYVFSFKKMHLKLSSGKLRPFCLSLNVLSMRLGALVACVVRFRLHRLPVAVILQAWPLQHDSGFQRRRPSRRVIWLTVWSVATDITMHGYFEMVMNSTPYHMNTPTPCSSLPGPTSRITK